MSRHTRKRKQLPSYPIIPPYKSSIHPGNDFYSYVNGDWIRHVNMPPYLSSYGISEEIEGVINTELEDILHDARKVVQSKTNLGTHHPQYLLGTLTESVLNTSSQHLNVKFLHSLVSSLQCIRDLSDIGSSLGDFIRHQVSTIFECIISPMKTDSKLLRLILSPGSLGLPDISYYMTDGKHVTHIIRAYDNLLKKLGKEFDIPDLNQIIIMEQRIAKSILKSMNNEDEVLLQGNELKMKYPNIPWDSIFESAIGWSENELNKNKIVITSPNFLKDVNTWFHDISIEDWKRLLAGQLILHMLSLLPPPFDDWEFELFGHRMKGQREKMPQHRLALHLAEQWVGKSLGSEFIRLHVPTIVKTEAMAIANEIKHSASRILSTTEWLGENARKKAGIKVKSIYLGVAYPNKIEKNDMVAELYPDQMLKNILKLSELDFKDELKHINTPSKPHVWEDNVFAVNAYYYNESNRLVLPAGILRWPFFHKNASDGWNFGGLGCTIGHEISHAFDDDGKDYDEHGNRNPWWSKEEQMRYHTKTKELVNLYNKTKYYGKHLNGILTLSENIADLCGVSIALGALNRRIKGQTPEKRKKELCDFFTSYAVSWRTKEKKEKVLQALFMDVHSPPSARVNNIVCQFEEWYECFDVHPNHDLYKKPDERIRIF